MGSELIIDFKIENGITYMICIFNGNMYDNLTDNGFIRRDI